MSSIYRLTPAAGPDDPRWVLGRNHGEVVVRAASPAQARIVAAGVEDELYAPFRFAEDGVTNAYHSPFRDEQLYVVTDDASGLHPADGPPAVLAGLDGPAQDPRSTAGQLQE